MEREGAGEADSARAGDELPTGVDEVGEVRKFSGLIFGGFVDQGGGRGATTSRLRFGQWSGAGCTSRHGQDRSHANNE